MTTVLYHRDNDGFGAAYAAWTALGDNDVTYIGVQYGEPVPAIPEGTAHLYILDFSYDRETCKALAKQYALVVLDHHKTAQAALEGLKFAYFDLTKSGARLAWEHVWSFQPLPEILRYVEDYDLWKFALPYSKEVNLYVSSLPRDFEVWDNFDLATAISAGTAIQAFRDNQIKVALRRVRMMQMTVDGQTYVVPAVNATDNISELGNVLCTEYPDAPFSASYCDRHDQRSWSLRSVGDFDVSAVAKALGGGGHKNAAGFSTDLWWPQMHTDEFLTAFDQEASR